MIMKFLKKVPAGMMLSLIHIWYRPAVQELREDMAQYFLRGNLLNSSDRNILRCLDVYKRHWSGCTVTVTVSPGAAFRGWTDTEPFCTGSTVMA